MLRFCVSLGVLALAAGCGGSAAPEKALPTTVPVSGVVTLDGKPLQKAAIRFVPRGETKGVDCYGFTDDTGRYELTQLRGGAGAPPGEYTVAFSQFAKPDGTPVGIGPNDPPPADQGAFESLPTRLSNPTESKIVAQVPQGGGELKFDLKSR